MKKTIAAGLIAIFAVIILLAGWRYFLVDQAKKEIAGRTSNFSALESFEYKNLKVGLIGDSFGLSEVSLKLKGIKETIVIKEILIPQYKMENNYLVNMVIEFKGVGISSKDLLSDEFYSFIGNGSSEDLISDFACTYHYDPYHRTMVIKDLKIKAPDLAELDAGIKLTNIDPSVLSLNNVSSLLPYLIGVSISETFISYHDRSLLKNMLSAQATTGDSTLADFIKAFSGNIRAMLYREKDQKTKIVLEKFVEFLNNPQQIHITMVPSKPVPVGRFLWVRHLREVIGLLNVQVSI